jgi:hypothetical protein
MPRKKKTAEKAPEVIQGDTHGKDVVEQTQAARGIDKDSNKVDPGKAGSAASKPPLTDEMKARDAQIKEREDYLRSQGLDPDVERNNPGGGLKKVERADIKAKQYRGMVTVTGIHGQTHEKISARIELPEASGEDYVQRAFYAHHPAAIRDPSTVTIDPENKDDPNLRSRFE